MDFSGKNVWVTGAGKGIGYATALAFVEAGAKVTGFDQAFTQEQYPFATEVMDVADAAQVAQVCQRLLAETERLDVLVIQPMWAYTPVIISWLRPLSLSICSSGER